MSVLGILENGLFALGQVLRFPVMTLLWVCVAAVLFMAGQALFDFLARRRERLGFDIEKWLEHGASASAPRTGFANGQIIYVPDAPGAAPPAPQ